jgi:hypothetical protein
MKPQTTSLEITVIGLSVRNRKLKGALEKIERGCEAVLLDAGSADEPVSRDVLLSVLTDARNGLREEA